MSPSKGSLLADRLPVPLVGDGVLGDSARLLAQLHPPLPNHCRELRSLDARAARRRRDPLSAETPPSWTDPGNPPIRSGSRNVFHLLRPHDGQPIGFPEVRGDLGDELVRPDAGRAGEALAREDLRLQRPGMHPRRARSRRGTRGRRRLRRCSPPRRHRRLERRWPVLDLLVTPDIGGLVSLANAVPAVDIRR